MDETGFDDNDLRVRKAVNDERLAAGNYVLQQPIDTLFRWYEAERARALGTRDDKWFEGQRKAIRAFKTSKLKPNPFGLTVLRACERIVWANRAQSQENTARHWREQRKQNIARGTHGRNINPEVVEQMERERKRQLAMTKAEHAERIRTRNRRLQPDDETVNAIRQISEENAMRRRSKEPQREEKRRQQQARGSYLADFAPAGERLYRLSGSLIQPEDVLNELKNVDHVVNFLSGDRLEIAGRIFKGDGTHDAQAHACDEIRKLMQLWFSLMFASADK